MFYISSFQRRVTGGMVRASVEEISVIGLSHSCLSVSFPSFFPACALPSVVLGRTGMTLDSREDRIDNPLYDKGSRLPPNIWSLTNSRL